MGEVILQANSLSKTYGPVKALIDVDFQIERGEVRALLGKNGAGKSTLVNLLTGSELPDSGSGAFHLGGQKVEWRSPLEARLAGISVVRQEFSLIPGLSVAENISLGLWPTRNRRGLGLIDSKTMHNIAEKTLEIIGENISPNIEVGDLSLAQRQLIEIAKALAVEPKILILDEPTSALNIKEADNLLALVRNLAATGISIIYVSHRMQEIPRVADTLTVLRDGEIIATDIVKNVSTDQVARLVAGETNLDQNTMNRRSFENGVKVLEVRNLKNDRVLKDISFVLREKEVLGIAGLLGSGRTEILEAIFGVRKDKVEGEIFVYGEKQNKPTARSMLKIGVGLTPEDRRELGIFPLMGVGEKIVISARGRSIKGAILHANLENSAIKKCIERMRVATSSPAKLISTLSGGNQQKAVIGRLLVADMKILLLDEPTRGIDISSKVQIYNLIRELAEQGVASIFISSEFEELSQVCDRVLILSDGIITEEISGEEATPEKLLAATMKGGLK